MSGRSVETELFNVITEASLNPTSANLYDLLSYVEQVLSGLVLEYQLKLAGELFFKLTEVYISRSESLLNEWEIKFNPIQEEPILTSEMLQDVLRQTMTLDLEGILEKPNRQPRTTQPDESIAGVVEKANILEFIELEKTAQQAIAVSHNENISHWIHIIDSWFQKQKVSSVKLIELQSALQMPLVSLWLALLLSNYSIEQRGNFYQTETVWVCQKSSLINNQK